MSTESLAAMHRRIGYNYLAGEEGYDGGMMGCDGRDGMMGAKK